MRGGLLRADAPTPALVRLPLCILLVRDARIELAFQPWEGRILPLN